MYEIELLWMTYILGNAGNICLELFGPRHNGTR